MLVEVFSPNRDNAGKAEMLYSFKCLQLGAGEGLLWAGRGSELSVWRVRMLSGTYLSHCSSVFVFRLFGGSDQGWLFSCFVLQQRKQSILLVHLVAKGGFYFKL